MNIATPKLAFIDMDGTTLLGTAAQTAADYLGEQSFVAQLDLDYLAGRVSASDYLRSVARIYVGRNEEELAAAFQQAELRPGVLEFVEFLQERGWRCYLCTITWTFAARAIAARVGFDGYCGAQMQSKGGVLTGEVLADFSERDKATFALEMCQAHGADPQDCFAVGDSRSDVCIFGVVGTSIAISDCASLVGKATHVCTIKSFTELIPLITSRFERSVG